jgi:hypothetical protein
VAGGVVTVRAVISLSYAAGGGVNPHGITPPAAPA